MNKGKRMAKEWEIWDKEEEIAKSEAEVRKLVLECFHILQLKDLRVGQ